MRLTASGPRFTVDVPSETFKTRDLRGQTYILERKEAPITTTTQRPAQSSRIQSAVMPPCILVGEHKRYN
jgi:hypothetical protein